jgi:hypothetical protein
LKSRIRVRYCFERTGALSYTHKIPNATLLPQNAVLQLAIRMSSKLPNKYK